MIKKTYIKRINGKNFWHMPRADATRTFTEEYVERGIPGDYARWLVALLGRPMDRALLKARQRYQAQKPAQIRASALHAAYARRR